MLNSLGLPFYPTRLISRKRNDEKNQSATGRIKNKLNTALNEWGTRLQ